MESIFESIFGKPNQNDNNPLKDLLDEVFNKIKPDENKKEGSSLKGEVKLFDVIKAVKQRQNELIPDKGVERLFIHSANERHLTAIINGWDYKSDNFKDQNETLKFSINNYLSSNNG